MHYVDAEYIIALHAAIIEETGGSHGIRDQGLLQSIVARPRQQFSGKDLYPDVFSKAAVYLDSIARHHVFIDGNKRTSLAVAAYFLHLNRLEITATNKQLELFVMYVVTQKPELREIAQWLGKHSQEINSGP